MNEGRTLRIVTSNDDDYEEILASGKIISGAEEDAKIKSKFKEGFGPNNQTDDETESGEQAGSKL